MEQEPLKRRVSREQVPDLQESVRLLRTRLNALDAQKEQAFSQKQELGRQVKERILTVKKARELRDSLAKEIKSLKEKRDASNKKLGGKLKELSMLKKQKESALKGLKIKENPVRLKKEIEQLELKIQTESMPFEKEQELMKKIKLMKKAYEESKGMAKAQDSIEGLKQELDAIRKEGNDAHMLVQEKARQSQEEHERLLKLSKEIDELTAQEEAAYAKFLELKGQFRALNEELKVKLNELGAEQSRITAVKKEKRARRIEQEVQTLRSKEEVVEEKIRTGKKLTTEDILILQSRSSEDF
ncbi:hypothetical protein HYV81_06160 [Candidatus Woesearchaeota archaeon]|nr:hypothetical protein [Candidatus Woesearchaeota archaeon]